MRRTRHLHLWLLAGVLCLAAGIFALLGWLLMLVIGALHHETGWPPFTLSFWPCVGIVAALSVLGQTLRGEPLISISTQWRY